MSEPALRPVPVAVAVSGGGRTLANLLHYQGPSTPFKVAAVIASRADCYGAEVAKQHALPLFVGDFAAPETVKKLDPWLQEQAIEWVALAGFLKLFPPIDWLRQRVVNIHPALLPRFGGHGMYGAKVHTAVIAAGEPVSGATVHFVNDRYDEGKIIAQISVPVLASDSPAALADRVFAAECKLYPEVLARLVSGSLPRTDGAIETLVYEDKVSRQGMRQVHDL